MIRTMLRTALPALAVALLLSGCVGWGHPMYGGGHHHDGWYDGRPYDRPMGPRYAPPPRCTDDDGRAVPCPAER